jgi:hypothetical protein
MQLTSNHLYEYQNILHALNTPTHTHTHPHTPTHTHTPSPTKENSGNLGNNQYDLKAEWY